MTANKNKCFTLQATDKTERAYPPSISLTVNQRSKKIMIKQIKNSDYYILFKSDLFDLNQIVLIFCY